VIVLLVKASNNVNYFFFLKTGKTRLAEAVLQKMGDDPGFKGHKFLQLAGSSKYGK
jgi:hypothetical protein